MNNKVLNIRLRRKNNKVMSVWEIQDFMNKLVTNYYKIDIINEVSKIINSDINLEKIVIMDKSFDFKVNYRYLADTDIINLSTESGAKDFFHLGTPTGLFPSKEVLELKVKLNLVRKINNFLHNKKIDRLNKNDISYIMYLDIEKAINFIEEKSKELIIKNFDEEEVRTVYFGELKKLSLEEKNSLEIYDKREIDIECLKEQILNANIEIIKNVYQDVYNSYFCEFTKQIMKLERPVVGVLSDDNKSFRILCKSYIHKKTRDERFLDLKNFSHNSPTIVEISAGLMFAVPMIPLIKGIKDSFENKISEQELDYREIRVLEKLSNIEDKLTDVESKENLANVRDINIKVVNQSMKTANEEFINRMNNNLATYNFDNYNININVVDFEKERIKRKKLRTKK